MRHYCTAVQLLRRSWSSFTKKMMSHSRDGPGAPAPLRRNIVPLTAAWNPPPPSVTPLKKVPNDGQDFFKIGTGTRVFFFRVLVCAFSTNDSHEQSWEGSDRSRHRGGGHHKAERNEEKSAFTERGQGIL